MKRLVQLTAGSLQAVRMRRIERVVLFAVVVGATVLVRPAVRTQTPQVTFEMVANFGVFGGANPLGGLARGADGALYGTTTSGPSGCGSVYRLGLDHALTVVHTFQNSFGCYPAGELVSDAGSLWGTTYLGGTSAFGSLGTIFKIDLPNQFTVVHNFQGAPLGTQPYNGVIKGPDGAFYGTTTGGSQFGGGLVFRISSSGQYSVFHQAGFATEAGLTLGSDGAFYGTTREVVLGSGGTIFRLTMQANLQTLYSFPTNGASAPNGRNLLSEVVEGPDGSLYGTAHSGGPQPGDEGTVYRLWPDRTLTVLHAFSVDSGSTTYSRGRNPSAGLTLGSDGNLYGITHGGGNGNGVIYRVSPSGAFTRLHAFTTAEGFNNVQARLLETSPGVFYGATGSGVFRLTVPINRAPVAHDHSFAYVEDAPPVRGLFLTATDADNDALTFSIVRQPTIATIRLIDASTGEIELAPNPNAFGDDTFTFQVSDGTATSNVATVHINLSPRNDAPVATSGSFTVAANASGGGTLQATDVENDLLTFALVAPPALGTLTVNAGTGAFTYTPQAGVSGSDSFAFRANDGELNSNTATIAVTITPPVADTVPPSVVILSPNSSTFVSHAGSLGIAVRAADASGVLAVSYQVFQICIPEVPCLEQPPTRSGLLTLGEGTATEGLWYGQTSVVPGLPITIRVTAADTWGNLNRPFGQADNDGIAPEIDRALDAYDQDASSFYSSEFNTGSTIGRIHRQGLSLLDLRSTETGGVRLRAEYVAPFVGHAPHAGVCTGSGKQMFFDITGEELEFRCIGDTLWARAIVASPEIVVRKLVTERFCLPFQCYFEHTYWAYTTLPTGQAYSTGSPFTADPENTEPIRVEFRREALDGSETLIGWMMLDPGETADPAFVAGPVEGSVAFTLTSISGQIEVNMGGAARIVAEGEALSLLVWKASQTIDFGALADRTFGESPFDLTATASSGLPVSYSASGSCVVSGSLLTVTGVNGCSITATQNGDATYEAASPVTRSFQVTYAWSGFQSPIANNPVKAGNNVPVKFQLTGASASLTTLQARLFISRDDGAEIPASSTRPGDNLFRYDPALRAYVFNWNTKSLALGAWRLRVDLGDGVGRTIGVTLVK